MCYKYKNSGIAYLYLMTFLPANPLQDNKKTNDIYGVYRTF